MREFFSSIKFKILIGIVAFLIGVMIYAASTAGEVSFFSSFVGFFTTPAQKLSTSISEQVSSKLDMITNAQKYYDENQQLKNKLDELYKQMADYEKIKQENENYQKILDLNVQYPDYKFSAPCKIIGRATNDVYQSFFIDKGSNDGIELHDPVIVGEGLVGIVSDVQMTYSKVSTILSPEFPLGVLSVKTKDTGLIQGSIEYAIDGLTKMNNINRNSEISEGDIIVTSGHSGLVPKDRIIGTVESVEMDKNGLALVASIKPVVDLQSVTNVFVITEFEGQGEGFNE